MPVGSIDAAPQRAAAEAENGAGALGITEEGEHQAVTVDDAGGRREQGGGTGQFGFESAGLCRTEPAQVVDAVSPRPAACSASCQPLLRRRQRWRR
jgi:hypothetical protein